MGAAVGSPTALALEEDRVATRGSSAGAKQMKAAVF